VPIHNYYKFNKYNSLNYRGFTTIRTYSTLPYNNVENKNLTHMNDLPVKVYENAYCMKKDILKENKGKSGIYL
jgi:hypothetical protein